MIEVSVEVREGDAPFMVAVRAESIGQAVRIVMERHPGRDVRVVFPIDPESFFLGGPSGGDGGEPGGQKRGLPVLATRRE